MDDINIKEISEKLNKADQRRAVLGENEKNAKKRIKDLNIKLKDEFSLVTFEDIDPELEDMQSFLQEQVKLMDGVGTDSVDDLLGDL